MKISVSNANENESFTVYLNKKIENEVLICEDEKWTIFLKDHEMLIREHSKWVELDKEVAYRYRYRMREYLEHELELSPDLVMAFRIVNRFYFSYEFNADLEGFYLPDRAYINELRSIYATNKSLYNKIMSEN